MASTEARRRARDEGSIRVRGAGKQRRYQAAYSLTTGGERKRITKTFLTRRDATRWLNDQLGRKDQGLAAGPTSMTVADLLDAWMAAEGDNSSGWQPSYAWRNRLHVEQRLKPVLGRVKLRELKPVHVQRMVDALAEPGARMADRPNKRTIVENRALSGQTRRQILGVLTAAIKWAMKRRLIDHDVTAYVRKPAAEKRRVADHIWSGAQLGTFLDATSETRDWTLWRMAAYTGMRRGELLGLQWSDVDFERSTLRVQRRRTRVGAEMVEGDSTKSGKDRTVDLDADTLAALKRWQRQLREEKLAAPPGVYVETPWVFVNEIGQPLHGDQVDGRWRRTVAKAGVPKIRFHDLRHTHASLLLAHGVDPVAVASRLGHADTSMIFEVYGHAIPGRGASVAAAFAAAVDG